MSAYDSLKEACFESNLLLPEFKLIDLTFGNVSVADTDKGVFAIKPSGVDYRQMMPTDMVVLDFEGKTVEGKLRPSSDTPTHLRLYQAFKGIGAVVHTHSRNATAFAQAGKPIPCFGTTHADYFYGEIPVTRALTADEIARGYELETGNVIVERFKDIDHGDMSAVLVRHHAPFVWGPHGKKAVENAFALEICAEMAIKALQLSPDIKNIPPDLLSKHFKRKHGPSAYYGQGDR
ncbi:MAG: L-ribulose-5-phosphate 4-epimerase AraD [Verrucomicrobiota bacterium]|nr:L-ribulose-5-phosphate 4-epimerase AraD [Verrucomicrobiota bacterium]